MNQKQFIEKTCLIKTPIEECLVKINTEKITIKCPQRSNNNSTKRIGK